MGRKTFVSLRRPLPGRTNIVSPATPIFAPGAVVTTSFADARAVAPAMRCGVSPLKSP